MAQIQEYLPEVEAQGPVGGVSPNIELASATGRGIEHLGEQLEEGADLLHRRAAQQETADVYSTFADKRAQYLNQIQQQTQDGTLNVDNIKQQYEDDISNIGQNLDTPEGRNFFERQQSRLKATVLQTAAKNQAVLARNQTISSWKDGVSQSSTAIYNDPSQYKDTYDAGVETVDEMIKNQGLPEKMRDQAVQQMGVEYAKAAVTGTAKTDPDLAKKLLDNGEFDQHLNAQQKEQMYKAVEQQSRANDIEKSRAQKAVDDAKAAVTDKWFNDNYQKMEEGTLSTKDIMAAQKAGTLDWQDANRALKLVDESAKREFKTDPRLKNAIANRITNLDSPNAITDDQSIDQYVGKGLSISDANQLRTLLNRTPEQKAQVSGEKALFKSIDSTVRFKNMMTNQYDVAGEKKAAQAKFDYIQAKKDIQTHGGNPADLVNPNSPLYFGNRIQDYQTSPQDALTHQAQDRTNKALGVPSDEHQNPTPAKDAKKPEESGIDGMLKYKKRLGF